MKIIIKVIFVSLFILSGCGSSTSATTPACSTSALLGTYTGSIAGHSDTMVAADSCAVTSSYCQSQSTIPNAIATTGTLIVTNTATNAKTGCLPLGNTSCGYIVTSTTLTFNCGNSTLVYTKQ